MSAATSGSLLGASAATVGVEIAPRRVTAVSVDRRGSTTTLVGHATETLPPGAVVPNLTGPNIVDRDVVSEALRRALGRLNGRPKRISLAVPDALAKVSLLRFEKVPPHAEDLDQLIRWQMRKTAPFRIEEAQLTCSPGVVLPEGGREFIVALARRDIVQEYEGVCAQAGAHAGVVDLATFNLINLLIVSAKRDGASADGQVRDWLLVHVTPEYGTIAIVRGEDLVFFRTRRADAEGDLADMVHQTAMYYEDRLGGTGFSRVVLAGATADMESLADSDAIRRNLQTRLSARVDPIDPRTAVSLGENRVPAEAMDEVAASIGLLVRESSN